MVTLSLKIFLFLENIVYMIVNLKRSLHFSFVKFVRSSLFRLFKKSIIIFWGQLKNWSQSKICELYKLLVVNTSILTFFRCTYNTYVSKHKNVFVIFSFGIYFFILNYLLCVPYEIILYTMCQDFVSVIFMCNLSVINQFDNR